MGLGKQSGYRVLGKKIALAVSLGVDEHEYRLSQKYKYTLAELPPLWICKSRLSTAFAYYGIELNSSDEWIGKKVLHFIWIF